MMGKLSPSNCSKNNGIKNISPFEWRPVQSDTAMGNKPNDRTGHENP